jgi:hypothetical protein
MFDYISSKIKEHGWLLLSLEAVMVLGAIIGSTILAMNVDVSKWGYVFFTMSSAAGLYVGVKRGVISLTLLNLYFTIINVTGVYRWFS